MNNISIEANHSTYHGIKRLWQAEKELWLRDLDRATYSVYKIPNSNYNLEEYWIVDKPDDLVTLKKYLKDFDRVSDFELKVKVNT